MIETNPVGRGEGGLSSHKFSPTNTNDPNAPWNGSNGPSVWPCWVPKSSAASAGRGLVWEAVVVSFTRYMLSWGIFHHEVNRFCWVLRIWDINKAFQPMAGLLKLIGLDVQPRINNRNLKGSPQKWRLFKLIFHNLPIHGPMSMELQLLRCKKNRRKLQEVPNRHFRLIKKHLPLFPKGRSYHTKNGEFYMTFIWYNKPHLHLHSPQEKKHNFPKLHLKTKKT